MTTAEIILEFESRMFTRYKNSDGYPDGVLGKIDKIFDENGCIPFSTEDILDLESKLDLSTYDWGDEYKYRFKFKKNLLVEIEVKGYAGEIIICGTPKTVLENYDTI